MRDFRIRPSQAAPSAQTPSEEMQQWIGHPQEGQLSIDVFRDEDALMIRSTVAGVKPDDIDIAIHGDLLTIRGKRETKRDVNEDDWFYRECYWGSFSRSIILPLDVYPERAQATIADGMLELRLPIRTTQNHIPVKQIDEDSSAFER